MVERYAVQLNRGMRVFKRPFLLHGSSMASTFQMEIDLTFKRAIDYYLWQDIDPPQTLRVCEVPKFWKGVPVGTVDFVESAMEAQGITPPPPLDVPGELRPHLFRGVWSGLRKDIDAELPSGFKEFPVQYKELNKTKGLTAKLKPGEDFPKGSGDTPVRITQWLDFVSEWRIFVYNGEAMASCCYQGDPIVFPSSKATHKMILDFKGAPPAYTLDVGVSEWGATVLIETHHFYGCGQYGFTEWHTLKMWEDWWEWWKNKESAGKERLRHT